MSIRSFLLTVLIGLLGLSGATLAAVLVHQQTSDQLLQTRQATNDMVTVATQGSFLVMDPHLSPERVQRQWERLKQRMITATTALVAIGDRELAEQQMHHFRAADTLMAELRREHAAGRRLDHPRLQQLSLATRSRLAIIVANAETAQSAARSQSNAVQQRTLWMVIGFATLLPLVQLALLFFTQRNLLPQIHTLIQAATRIRSGDLDRPVPQVRRAGRELAQLTGTLETMRSALLTNQQKLEERNGQLRAKSEEVEAFVYAVSHDLRGPLVNLVGFTKELRLTLDGIAQTTAPTVIDQSAIDDLRLSVDFISGNARKLESLIDALLRLSRSGRQELEPTTIDPAPIIQETLDSLRKRWADIQPSYDLAELPLLHIDPSAAERIFSNLLENAHKYRHPERPLEIRISGTQTADGVSVMLADNGLGFPDSAQEKLFRAFQRYHPDQAEGEGMGLAIVYRLVERSGGSIALDDRPGGGTIFTLVLPGPPEEPEGPTT